MSNLLLTVCPYILLAAGMVLSLALFVMLKAEIQKQGLRAQRDLAASRELVDQLTRRIEGLEARIARQRQEPVANVTVPAVAVPPSPTRQTPLNDARRTEILSLAIAGKNPEQIASQTGAPKHEVALLLKLQQQQRKSLAVTSA